MNHIERKSSFQKKLDVFERILLGINILVGLFIMSYPYFPEIQYQFDKIISVRQPIITEIQSPLAPVSFIAQPSIGIYQPSDLKEKYLYIPTSDIYQSIVTADTIHDVHEHIWLRTPMVTPASHDKIVLAAHRYVTIGGERASTFYHLPKMDVGDYAYIRWDNIMYRYQFVSSEIVAPTDISIEQPTGKAELTLYTCTPLWSGTDRYVVHALLVDTFTL